MSDLTDRLAAIGVECPEVAEYEASAIPEKPYTTMRLAFAALSALVTIAEQQHDEMHTRTMRCCGLSATVSANG